MNLRPLGPEAEKICFFEHHCLHIVRIFREITPFCTLFPLFPYRTIPVVVSYVVKPGRTVTSGTRSVLENLLSPITKHTRVEKNTHETYLLCCIITPIQTVVKRLRGKILYKLKQRKITMPKAKKSRFEIVFLFFPKVWTLRKLCAIVPGYRR